MSDKYLCKICLDIELKKVLNKLIELLEKEVITMTAIQFNYPSNREFLHPDKKSSIEMLKDVKEPVTVNFKYKNQHAGFLIDTKRALVTFADDIYDDCAFNVLLSDIDLVVELFGVKAIFHCNEPESKESLKDLKPNEIYLSYKDSNYTYKIGESNRIPVEDKSDE